MTKFEGGALVAPITARQVETEYVDSALIWWRKSKGIVSAKDRHLDRLFSMIQICANGPDIWPPQFLYIGHEAEILRLYGSDYQTTAPGQMGVPDPGYEYAVNGAYQDAAASDEAIISHVRAKTLSHLGIPIWFEYQRLILPGTLASGRPVFLTFSKVLRLLRGVAGEDWLPTERREA